MSNSTIGNDQLPPEENSESSRRAPAPASSGALRDLSAEVARAVAREPLDRVHCVRVFENNYRCNWWSPMPADREVSVHDLATNTTHRIRKSRFLTAQMQGEVLEINEDSGRPTPRAEAPGNLSVLPTDGGDSKGIS